MFYVQYSIKICKYNRHKRKSVYIKGTYVFMYNIQLRSVNTIGIKGHQFISIVHLYLCTILRSVSTIGIQYINYINGTIVL